MKTLKTANHIVTTPGFRSGRPRIAGTGPTVADVATLHLKMDLSLEEICGKYDVSPAAVHAAMAYYYDHRREIEAGIARDNTLAQSMKRSSPSLLRRKPA
jgi:uncharacterized protein (DUF433 family)